MLYILKDSLSALEGYASLPTSPTKDRKPRVAIRMGNRRSTTVFDTGFNGYITLRTNLQDSTSLPTLARQAIATDSHFGEKALTENHTDVDTIYLGDQAFATNHITFSGNLYNVIGTQFFAEYPIIFDFAHEQVWLDTTLHRPAERRKQHIKSLANQQRNDLGLLFQWQSDSTLLIGPVQANSPAALNKLRTGQRVRTINGKIPSSYFTDYCEFLHWNYQVARSDSLQVQLVSQSRPVLLKKTNYRASTY